MEENIQPIVEDVDKCIQNKPSTSTGWKSNLTGAFESIKTSNLYEEVLPKLKDDDYSLRNLGSKINSKNCVTVSSRQRGNPILKHIRNVPYEYGEIVPDYVMGATTCALFLSLKYHTLNPNYIHDRMKLLGQQYILRVLLALVDVKDPFHELKQLTKICVMADFTLMLAWSSEEAARIIEVYKIFEHKPPELIMEKQDENPYSMIVDALISIKSVSRTDAMVLLSTFGSLEGIVNATDAEISICPGFGLQKVKRLQQVLQQKFKR